MITGNQGKAEEFQSLLAIPELDFRFLPLPLPEIQSDDIAEIGKYKTQEVFKFDKEIQSYDAVMTDDTGLALKALNGLPGPLIKWFLKALSIEGLYNLADQNNSAIATCLLTVGFVGTAEIIQFRGDVEGRLVAPRGTRGFGWDPIFLPIGQSKTYGELSSVDKNKMSHRALAVNAFRNWIVS